MISVVVLLSSAATPEGVQVPKEYIHGPQSSDIGTPLRPRYIPHITWTLWKGTLAQTVTPWFLFLDLP